MTGIENTIVNLPDEVRELLPRTENRPALLPGYFGFIASPLTISAHRRFLIVVPPHSISTKRWRTVSAGCAIVIRRKVRPRRRAPGATRVSNPPGITFLLSHRRKSQRRAERFTRSTRSPALATALFRHHQFADVIDDLRGRL